MSLSSKPKVKGSARSQIGIKEVKEGILILSDNRYRSILATSSVNFELQSEEEQDVIVDAFQAFLNLKYVSSYLWNQVIQAFSVLLVLSLYFDF